MRELLALAHARSACATLPDRLRLAWRALRDWWHAAVLAWIDRFLRAQGQERAYTLPDFEELEVLYDEQDFQVVVEQDDWPGWQEYR
jgi:hypothetical protein